MNLWLRAGPAAVFAFGGSAESGSARRGHSSAATGVTSAGGVEVLSQRSVAARATSQSSALPSGPSGVHR